MSLARVFLIALLAATIAHSEVEEVRVHAHLDWSEKMPHTKRARWHPVHITMESHVSKDLQGTVHVEVERGNSQVIDLKYQRSMALPSGGKKRFDIDIWLEGSETSLYVIADFGLSKTSMVGLPIAWIDEKTDTILVVSPAPGAFKRFERSKDGPNYETYNPARELHPIATEDLPETWRGIDGVETILWDATSFNELSTGQAEAIREWVEMGGNLVLAAGDEAQTFFSGPLAQVVPGKYVGRKEVNPAAELARAFGMPAPTKSDSLLAAEIAATEGVHWKTGSGMPLLIERRVGLGRVCLVPFDLSSDTTMGAKYSDELVDHLLDYHGFTVFHRCTGPIADEMQVYPAFSSGGPPRIRSELGSGSLSDRIASSFKFTAGLHVPPARTIGLFLGLYIAACLLNVFAWRTAHRREFAWVTLLFLAVGFAGYAYRDARLNAQAAPSIQHVTIQEIGPDGRAGRSTTWYGFYSPVSQKVDVAASDLREGLTLASWDRTSSIGESTLALVEGEGPLHVHNMPMLPRSVTCARGESPCRLTTPMQVHARIRDCMLTVDVPKPTEGAPLSPLLFWKDRMIRFDASAETDGYHLRRSWSPPEPGSTPLNELVSELESMKIEANMLVAFQQLLHGGAVNGESGFVLLPVLEAPRPIVFAGRRTESERGLTLLVLDICWDSVDYTARDLTWFCRETAPQHVADSTVIQLSPLWEGPPALHPEGGSKWNWVQQDWDARANVPDSSVQNPFSGAVRIKWPDSWQGRPCVIYPR